MFNGARYAPGSLFESMLSFTAPNHLQHLIRIILECEADARDVIVCGIRFSYPSAIRIINKTWSPVIEFIRMNPTGPYFDTPLVGLGDVSFSILPSRASYLMIVISLRTYGKR